MTEKKKMTFDDLTRIVSALARTRKADEVLNEVAHAFRIEIGFRLLTFTAIDQKALRPVRRLWSNHPDLYPVGGSKDLAGDEWSQTVIQSRQAMICHTLEDIERIFPDHGLIASLGCGAGLNLPVVLQDEVLGTVNLFNVSKWFTPARVERAQALLALVYAPMLLARERVAN